MKKIILITALTIIMAFGSACSTLFQNGVEPIDALQENAPDGRDSSGKSDIDCSTQNPHPLAKGITEDFEITYNEVMILYCDGNAFSDILLALETAELVDESPAALLARLRTRSWEEIWDEYGINPE